MEIEIADFERRATLLQHVHAQARLASAESDLRPARYTYCFGLHWLGRSSSARRIGQPRTLSGTKLRRTLPSFTVEVRRRPRLAAASRPKVQSLETKPPPAAFDRESRPAEAAPPPPIVEGYPSAMSEDERQRLGLRRLPQTLAEALVALAVNVTSAAGSQSPFTRPIMV